MQARNDMYSEPFFPTILQSLDFIYQLQSSGAAGEYEHLEEVCLLEIQKIVKLIAHILDRADRSQTSGAGKTKQKPRETADLLIEYMDAFYREEITLQK